MERRRESSISENSTSTTPTGTSAFPVRSSKLIEDNPLLAINVKLWKFLSVIFDHNWRCYLFVAPVCLLNAMQFVNLFRIWGDLAPFILNTFFTAAIFDALLRTCLVIINREKFEAFMRELDTLYREIEASDDVYARHVLKKATLAARNISIFNLVASFFDIIGALLHPLFSEKRLHPFGVAIPMVDMTCTPVYQIVYAMQLPFPLVLTAMYMPFVSLFASYAMFGKSMLVILQHRLEHLCPIQAGPADGAPKSELSQYEDLKACIQYYARIVRYVKEFNSLVTYIVLVEFLLFGGIICLLLFCINIIESATQIINVIMYIFTMLYVLFTYYWQANELLTESLKISEATYAMGWYHCSPRFKRTLLLFIMRSQKPLKIMVGNVYPMTLETFQSLLNASYSYFSVLRGVYN